MTNNKQGKFFSGIKDILDANAPTLATFGSVIGVGLTIFFMHRASKNAAQVEEKYEEDIQEVTQECTSEDGKVDEKKLKEETGHLKMNKCMRLIYIYRWGLLSGIGSAGFAVLSNYLNGRTIAAITGLLALNNEKLKIYAKKAKEMVGEEKFKELQSNMENELFGERVRKKDFKVEKPKNIEITDSNRPEDGCERYFDCYTCQVCELPEGRLKDAIAEATRIQYLTWNDWLGMLGYESAPIGNEHAWDKDGPFKAHIGYVNLGDYGMKAICYDHIPYYNRMSK